MQDEGSLDSSSLKAFQKKSLIGYAFVWYDLSGRILGKTKVIITVG